jgi:flagellar biogenesis protein FliO
MMIAALLAGYPMGLPAQTTPSTNRATAVAPAENTTDSAATSMPLKPRAAGRGESERRPGGTQSIATIVGSLAAVLVLFFLVAWILRRASPNAAAALPSEAFEVLGRASLPNRQQIQLLRCGGKMLFVSITAAGMNTLTEITEPREVDRLVNLCRKPPR